MAREHGTNLAGVERALSVLQAFGGERPVLRVADVARLCDVGTSTASRLLATLVVAGMVDRDELGHYRLGHGVLTLAGRFLNTSALCRETRAIAFGLSCELGLGANVAELRDGRVFYLLNFDGRLTRRAGTLMGQTNVLHATGLGKCLLSAVDGERRQELLGVEPYPRYTVRTLTSRESLEAELATVSARGYATDREELALGRSCVAAPIRGRSGAVIAAVSLSGPLSAIRLDEREDELAERVLEAADHASTALGATPTAIDPDGGRLVSSQAAK